MFLFFFPLCCPPPLQLLMLLLYLPMKVATSFLPPLAISNLIVGCHRHCSHLPHASVIRPLLSSVLTLSCHTALFYPCPNQQPPTIDPHNCLLCHHTSNNPHALLLLHHCRSQWPWCFTMAVAIVSSSSISCLLSATIVSSSNSAVAAAAINTISTTLRP